MHRVNFDLSLTLTETVAGTVHSDDLLVEIITDIKFNSHL